MPRTKRALSGVTTFRARFSAAAAAATLLAGLAATPATAGPNPEATVQLTGAISDQIELVRSSCPPETGGYDPMQDYVRTLIWWHYHPDWRVD